MKLSSGMHGEDLINKNLSTENDSPNKDLQVNNEEFADLRQEIKLLLDPEKLESIFLQLIVQKYPDNIDLIVKALDYAKKFHDGQYRDERTPYYTHGIYVALYLIEDGASYEEVIVALLHDVLEDNPEASYEEMLNLFGKKVAFMVLKLSKKYRSKFIYKTEEAYYLELAEDQEILRIKAFDGLSNILGLYFVDEGDYKSSYGDKIRNNVMVLLKDTFPDLYKRFEYVYEFIESNAMTDEEKTQIKALKEIAMSKANLKD